MIDAQLLSLGGLAGTEVLDTASNLTTLSSDFDDFLTLLTTQLQNQDPLDPTDSEEFTNQLVQFSQLEQQIQTNSTLDSLRILDEASVINSAVSFIDKSIQYEGSRFSYDGEGELDFGYYLLETANSTQISILDEDGNTVFSTDGEITEGEHSFTWDGLDNDGNPIEAGTYDFLVGAENSEGRSIPTSALVPGRVDGVEILNGTVFLNINDLLVGIDSVLSIHQ